MEVHNFEKEMKGPLGPFAYLIYALLRRNFFRVSRWAKNERCGENVLRQLLDSEAEAVRHVTKKNGQELSARVLFVLGHL